MTINERVRYFRKDVLHMNQTEFALSIGMKQTSVSSFEKEGATVSDQSIKAISSIHGVSEKWLRNGTEPMYIQPATFSLDDFAKSKGATPLELEILKTYFELDPEIRKAAMAFFKKKLLSAVAADPGLLIPDEEDLNETYPAKVGNDAMKETS